jgi:hypothetical protein
MNGNELTLYSGQARRKGRVRCSTRLEQAMRSGIAETTVFEEGTDPARQISLHTVRIGRPASAGHR